MAESIASTRSWSSFGKFSSSSSPPKSSSSSVRSLRIRSSFLFGRSRSNANKAQQCAPLEPTTEREDEELPARPPTSYSTQTHRRKAEPLDTIRNSILGGRRREPSLLSRARGNSNASSMAPRGDLTSASAPSLASDRFQTEDDYYRHLRKQSISTPFNFEHVTHTAKTQLPALDTVEEHDLPREFWSVSAHQRPKRHLKGIEAEDISKHRLRRDTDASRPSTSKSRPVSPLTPSELGEEPQVPTPIEHVGGLDKRVLDNVTEVSTHSEDETRTLQPTTPTVHHPRRYSSLNALREVEDGVARSRSRLATFYESDSSDPSTDAGLHDASNLQQEAQTIITTASVIRLPVDVPKQEDIEFKSRQPLPPLPCQHLARNTSKSSPDLKGRRANPAISLQIPAEHTWSPVSKRSSKRSSRSSRFLRESPSQSSSTDKRQSTSISDTTWEDDVDFIYEQEAESTCDFNWEVAAESLTRSGVCESAVSSAESPYHAHSPTSTFLNGGSIRHNSSKETIADRRHSRRGEHPTRATSVGHRGFLAARRSSQDLKQCPTQVQISSSSSHPSLLSPVFDVRDADEAYAKSPMSTATLNDAAVGCLNPDFLSDPESCRSSGSTRHRKSSSYSSHASSSKSVPIAARDHTARWSYASASSLPELMHSRPKGKLILSKTIISAPLESLPQSPPFEKDAEEGTIVPREFQTKPVRNSFIVRRPQERSDCAAMFAAGKITQERGSRGSAVVAPQSRISFVVESQHGVGGAPPAIEPKSPSWI